MGKHTEAVEQICITDNIKELIWKTMHTIPPVGHLGITKTYAKIWNRYFWPRMSEETTSYVQQCEICAQANKAH